MRPIAAPRLQALLAFAEATEGLAALLAYGTVAVLLIGDVVAREVLATPFLGAQSVAVLAAIAAGFLGLSLATAKGSHLRPAVFDALVPARLEPYVDRGSDVIAAAFYVAIAVFSVRFVLESRFAGDRAAVLYFPLWPIQLVMPYAFASCAFRHAAYAIAPSLKPAAPVGD